MLFCKLLLHGVVMGLTGLPNVFADSDHHIHEPVESTHHNPAKSAVIQDANTARLSKAQLRSRSIGYTSFFGGSIAVLGALGVVAVYKKNRILSIWHLQLAEGQLRWKGQPVCCHPHEYQTVRPSAQENQVVEALESGTREQLLQEELAEADPLVVKVLEKQALGLEANQTWLRKRTALLALLFGSYVATSIGIPLWNADKVSCANGFFWEDHIPFFCIFMVTKFTELALFVYDPTIQGELGLVDLMIKFVPSFMGYLDGYTDATAIVIARSCESQFAQNLALWMMATYLLGVIVGQWIVLACLATQDPTQACLMKLIHLDALSSCISLSGNSKNIWKIVNMVRTFGEDIPQAICQTLFIIYVKPNYFMILSVAVSVGSSLKALHDALHRGLVGLGVKFDDDEKKLYESSVRFSPCNCSVQSSSGSQTTLLDAVPKVGDNVWHDRGYTFTSLGDFAEKQMVFVKGSNDDKKIASSRVMWTFEVPCAVTVYLDFWDDMRHGMSPMYTEAKVWLEASNSGWELTEMRGVAFTPHFGPGRVYRQTFPAGRVEIMGKGVCDTGVFLAFLEDATDGR